MSATRPAAAASLRFSPGWRQSVEGQLCQGGALRVDYDPSRLIACRRYHGGMPAWDLWGEVRFHPSGERVRADLVAHTANGPGPPRVLDPPEPRALEVRVPLDATQAELWFSNTDVMGCTAWDSRFGENYWFDVAAAGPSRPVSYRTGAVPSLEMVNLLGVSADKQNTFPQPPAGSRAGTDLETMLAVEAWVANVAYQKNVWIDVHVFDQDDVVCHSETLTLAHRGPGGGGGDVFGFQSPVYQGLTATPGGPRPARTPAGCSSASTTRSRVASTRTRSCTSARWRATPTS
jgi:Family of unknown function (DUF6209)